MTLSTLEHNIITAKIMFGTDAKNAMAWLTAQGHKITKSTYHRRIRELDASAWKRLYEIPKHYHILVADEIVKMRNAETELYKQYHIEKDPTKKARIMMMIIQAQPYFTSLYEQTQDIVENKIRGDVESFEPEQQEDSLLS